MLYLIIIAVILVISYFIANEFYEIAVMKGYYERKYFWISFLFNVAGWLMIVALPVKTSTKIAAAEQNQPIYTQPETTVVKSVEQTQPADELPDL